MNKRIAIFLLLSAVACRSTAEVTFNYDRSARALQEKINDTNYNFYHEKNPPRIEQPIRITPDFRAEKELRSGNYVYRLRIDETGKFTYRALKPAPEFFETQIAALLAQIHFKPAWIGAKNFAAELDVDFIIEFEAY
ncbi:MAG: hypothetical protein KF713_16820 [Turneriella sp.]|nr:hypothetical protein [Turneriella sp.]